MTKKEIERLDWIRENLLSLAERMCRHRSEMTLLVSLIDHEIDQLQLISGLVGCLIEDAQPINQEPQP